MLAKILRRLPAAERTVLVSHLEDRSIGGLCEIIQELIHGGETKLTNSQLSKLRRGLTPSKEDLSLLCRTKSPATRRRKLQALGGNPLGLILTTALPLLLNTIFGRK